MLRRPVSGRWSQSAQQSQSRGKTRTAHLSRTHLGRVACGHDPSARPLRRRQAGGASVACQATVPGPSTVPRCPGDHGIAVRSGPAPPGGAFVAWQATDPMAARGRGEASPPPDQPGAGDPVGLGVLAGDPLHRAGLPSAKGVRDPTPLRHADQTALGAKQAAARRVVAGFREPRIDVTSVDADGR